MGTEGHVYYPSFLSWIGVGDELFNWGGVELSYSTWIIESGGAAYVKSNFGVLRVQQACDLDTR